MLLLVAVSLPMSVVAGVIVPAIETVSARRPQDKHLFECVGGFVVEMAVEG
jgi:hypothetical protein